MKNLIIVLFLLLSWRSFATDYYVSAVGSDAGAGTSTGTAWQTISKVTSSVGSFNAGDRILFRRGDVFYGTLPALPNGANAASKTTYGAYGTGARPVISGLTNLTSWSNLGSNLWSHAVNSGDRLDLVIISGVTRPQGRTPNAGSYFTIDSHTNLSGGSATITSTGAPAGTHNWTGAEMIVATNQYNRNRNRVTGHSSNTLTFTQESINNQEDGNKFFFQNDPYTLDAQNEWFYSASTHTLTMYSTANPSSLSGGVQAATLDYGFNDDPLTDIAFNNLKFTGFDSIGVRCRWGLRVSLTACTFDKIGIDAVVFDVGDGCDISNNTITDCGNMGLRLIYSKNLKVTYDTIQRMGLKEGMALGNNQQMDGILYENAQDEGLGTRIENNIITDVGYCGITFSGRNVTIARNYISNFGLMLSDGGGIYTCCNADIDGGYRTIEYNVIENGLGNRDMVAGGGTGGMPGIYMDDYSEFVNIRYNSIYKGSRYGIFLHNANNIIMYSNRIDSSLGEASIGLVHDALGPATTNIKMTNNIIYGIPSLPMYHFYSLTNDFANIGRIDGNIMIRSTSTTPFKFETDNSSFNNNYSLAQLQSTFGWEATGSFTTVNADSMRYVSNPTSNFVFVNLYGTYKNFLSNTKTYPSYILLEPFTSEIIRKITNVPNAAVNMQVINGKRKRNIKI